MRGMTQIMEVLCMWLISAWSHPALVLLMSLLVYGATLEAPTILSPFPIPSLPSSATPIWDQVFACQVILHYLHY